MGDAAARLWFYGRRDAFGKAKANAQIFLRLRTPDRKRRAIGPTNGCAFPMGRERALSPVSDVRSDHFHLWNQLKLDQGQQEPSAVSGTAPP